jgi:hypothetical protein
MEQVENLVHNYLTVVKSICKNSEGLLSQLPITHCPSDNKILELYHCYKSCTERGSRTYEPLRLTANRRPEFFLCL